MLPVILKRLRKDKIKDGKCPIILQVYINKQRRQIFTGLNIQPEYWDETVGLITKKYKDHDYFNRLLKQEYEKIESSYLREQLETGTINIKLRQKVSRQNYFDYAYAMFDGMKNTCTEGYIERSKSAIRAFEAFAGPINFQAITPQLLKKYEDSLFARGIKANTINRIFKRISQVFARAVKQGITDQNPFNIYHSVKYHSPKRNFLTLDEIKQIHAAEMPEALQSVRNYFLLACYTGLRFSDLSKFNKAKMIIHNNGVDRLILATTKTGAVVSIKIAGRVKEIIEKINKPLPTNVHTNRLLKSVCKVAGVKEVTFHISRHSFSVNCASLEFPIELVAKLLGHSNIKTTAIYYKIVDPKVDEYMDRWAGI